MLRDLLPLDFHELIEGICAIAGTTSHSSEDLVLGEPGFGHHGDHAAVDDGVWSGRGDGIRGGGMRGGGRDERAETVVQPIMVYQLFDRDPLLRRHR